MSSSDKIFSTSGRGRLYNSITETVGDTPVVKLHRIAPDHVNMYVKVEAFNPAASVKDRLALNIIEAAERSGDLKPGQTVVEATSGNTGIGLAMVCAAKGYPLVVTMADSFSIERRKLMRFLGAKVVLTPRAQKGFGMYQKAKELAEANGWFLAHQFETGANADIHAATTAQEILADFKDAGLDYFVTGYGTGGTVTGVARVLREKSSNTKIILSEPANAAIVSSVRDEFKILIGEKTAEELKLAVCSVEEHAEPIEATVRGRDLVTGLPREVVITDADVREAIVPLIDNLIEAIKGVLEATPPEVVSDIMQRGIYLSGGGAQIAGMAPLLELVLGIPVHMADDPLPRVVRGTGIILEDFNEFEEILVSHDDEPVSPSRRS